ncbi:adenylate cyclase [Pseudaminobacter sp. 19-2017]|uniref:Adenylate cyclase n=1 Tax=Pseudaminobacter soli (ex Zhang et al. 2022) TaxID=2831468 RepID=A0A942DZN3_9HYPH|nr:tetratricopeptide repeat protein [Pseudaminobacter soli]MBS3650368.1 adenylate cyclase [Pseudaminobacter soli]
MERRLAAVLAFDMVGYSRLMGADEEVTLAAHRRHRRVLFAPRATQYRGRIIKFTGDGALMEFASVVDSLCFSVEIQLALRDENEGVPEESQFRYRIGINIGDIIPEDGDIFGDGVNVAARLQEIADPGGICLSGAAYHQVRSKLDLTFEHRPQRRLKNIAEPVQIYSVRLDEKAERLSTPPPPAASTEPLPPRRRGLAFRMSAVLLLAAAAGLAWWQPWTRFMPSAPFERIAYPLPDRPSVAVLPFINVSGDKEQDHLAEGLTDDLITDLSKVSGLFVIARHSVLAIRETAATIQDVATELGVHYVLEGTLQRSADRLRINVKLIDALSGLSLWAERYDRQYRDLFAVQDDVIGKIISALEIRLSQGERDRLARIPTDNLEAYDYYMRAEQEGFFYSDVDTYRRTLSYYQQAIDLDPNFANAHAGIARVAVDVWRNDYNFLWSAAVARKIAYDAAGEALRLDPSNARAHTVLALLQLVDGRAAEARNSARQAVGAQPNDAEAVGSLALILAQTGSRAEAVREMERALRLDPTPAPSFQLLAGIVFYLAHDNERAIPLIEAARDALPKAEPAREYLSAAYMHDGNRTVASAERANLLKLFPDSNLTYYSYLYDYWREDDLAYHLDGLRHAGLPQWPFGFEGKATDQLREADLRRLVDNKTWKGRHKNGTEFFQYFDKAGNTAYRSANTNITGLVEIEDDRICELFAGYFRNRSVCGFVYRNTSPDEPGAQYVHVTPQALTFFSIEQ